MDAPSDLIVDVARAADPKRAAAMTQRLAALNVGGDVHAAAFSDALSAADVAPAPLVDARAALSNPQQAEASRAAKARQQFEATLLNSFVNEMMPKEDSSVFGGGYAGDMWRSLLAQKVSDAIAQSGRLGIAGKLFDSGHTPALAKLQRASKDASSESEVTVTSANALSLPSSGTVNGGAYMFARDKSS
jgi:peptidoglycan hydrolase FlgJ